MKRVREVIFLFVFVLSFSAFSQQRFPESWLGNWKGNLEIYLPDGSIKQSIPMEIHISKLNSEKRWQWKIIYNTTDIRDYELVEVDVTKGKYYIDEKNNILIDVTVFGNKTFSCFEVQDFTIFDTHTLIDDSIIFELNTSLSKDTRISGDGTEQIPTVKSFPQIGYQKAILIRQ